MASDAIPHSTGHRPDHGTDQRPPHIPVLRFGEAYESLDRVTVKDHRSGDVVAEVSQANPGVVRRDLKKLPAAAATLRAVPIGRRIQICRDAAELFQSGTLPLNDEGDTQSPDAYVRTLSMTSGMPHALCRANMAKVATVLRDMDLILRGLTRGLDLAILDDGVGKQDGVPVSFSKTTSGLGVILPSNSPGVNSIWIPALALGTPVILKPGREEPWTPLRIVRALIKAGMPRAAFGFYPTSHEGAADILSGCGRALLFGDAKTTAPWQNDPRVEIHGPGYSKVVIGEDQIDHFEDHLDVLIDSVAKNGGRSCINASTILVPRRGDAVADAIAARIAAIAPRPADDPDAALCAFANSKMADWIESTIKSGLVKSLAQGGADDRCAPLRDGPRMIVVDGAVYLRPTIVRCAAADHPLARTEFLFPFASVVEVPQARFLETMGPSLVATAITQDKGLIEALIESPLVHRLNIGPIPTSHVDWDQPHEGNLFEVLFSRRAIARKTDW